MLDHADFIARYDKHDALGVIAGMPEQIAYEYELPDVSSIGDISTIVLTGMGGSAQAAEFINNWLHDKLARPLDIVRDYTLPAYVDETCLVIASSYSGNTEEAVSALHEARKRTSKIVVLSSGGTLLEEAKKNDLPYFQVPGGFQPRMAVLYSVRALAQLLEAVGVADGLVEELNSASTWLQTHQGAWKADSPTDTNVAKQIASELVGHVAVVYAGPNLMFAAMKWKIAFNENAKNIAFYNYFPELDHNEFIGWAHPERSGLKVIELRSNLDNAQIQKRFDVTNRLLSSAFAPIEVMADGQTKLQELLWTILLGEYVATYLAFLNGIDPTPVDLVEKLKAELA